MGKRRMSREAALEALGVARDAPPEDVRRAYHRKALASHPDKGGSAAAFQQVKEAFEVAKRPAVAPAVAAARAAAAAPAPAPAAPTSTAHATLGGQAGYARVFRCYVCGEAFPSKRRLQHHTRTEHAAPDAPAAPARRLVNGRCNTCGWKTCQCETAPVWAAPPPPRRRRSARPTGRPTRGRSGSCACATATKGGAGRWTTSPCRRACRTTGARPIAWWRNRSYYYGKWAFRKHMLRPMRTRSCSST